MLIEIAPKSFNGCDLPSGFLNQSPKLGDLNWDRWLGFALQLHWVTQPVCFLNPSIWRRDWSWKYLDIRLALKKIIGVTLLISFLDKDRNLEVGKKPDLAKVAVFFGCCIILLTYNTKLPPYNLNSSPSEKWWFGRQSSPFGMVTFEGVNSLGVNQEVHGLSQLAHCPSTYQKIQRQVCVPPTLSFGGWLMEG